ncbi:urocortin 3, like [Vanacampus margaritifer]
MEGDGKRRCKVRLTTQSGLFPLFWERLHCLLSLIRVQRIPPTHAMLSLKTLLLLSVLCSPSSSLCLRLTHGRSDLLCDHQMAGGGLSPEDGWGPLLRSSAEYLAASASEESASRERRTSNLTKSRFQSRAKLRGSLLRNGGKEARRSQLTLSLDVPTNIMNVLFDVAKAQNLRAKAAENARLFARIGRRK